MEKNCSLCELIALKSGRHALVEDDDLIVFRSPQPLAPVHLIIAPKKHIDSLLALSEEDARLVSRIYLMLPELARMKSIYQCGFRILASHGPDAGVEEHEKHVHFHMLGGTTLTDKLA